MKEIKTIELPQIKKIMERYNKITIFARSIRYPDEKLDVKALEVKPEKHLRADRVSYIGENKIPDDKIPSCYLELRDSSYNSTHYGYNEAEYVNVILLSGEWLTGDWESKSRGLGIDSSSTASSTAKLINFYSTTEWKRNLLISPTGAAIVIYHHYREDTESTTDEGRVVLHV
ncbi:MAG: hypothetical protein N3A54_07065, partial [Patescibacteria group bacterium]|nr:hypothetical protein [Patescibacteria group bacterium]